MTPESSGRCSEDWRCDIISYERQAGPAYALGVIEHKEIDHQGGYRQFQERDNSQMIALNRNLKYSARPPLTWTISRAPSTTFMADPTATQALTATSAFSTAGVFGALAFAYVGTVKLLPKAASRTVRITFVYW
jgi:hypothetical protein